MEVIHLLQRSEVVRTTSTLGTETKATIKVITAASFTTVTNRCAYQLTDEPYISNIVNIVPVSAVGWLDWSAVTSLCTISLLRH